VKGEGKTGEDLMSELALLRRRVAELEALESELKVLLKKERQARTYVEGSLASSPDGVLLLDKLGRFGYVNPTFLKWLGREVEDFLGKTVSEVSPPMLRPEVAKSLAERVEKRIRAGGEPAIGTEVELIDKEGKPLPISYLVAVIRNETGNIMGEVVFLRDITERKQAEEALWQSEERYRTLFEGVPVGIYRTTPEGRILDANPARCRSWPTRIKSPSWGSM